MKCTLDPKSLPVIGSGAYEIMRTQEDDEPEVESEEEEVKGEPDVPKERRTLYAWGASKPFDLSRGHYGANAVFDNGMVFGVGPDADVWFYDGEKSRLLDFAGTEDLKMLEVAKDEGKVVCRSVNDFGGPLILGQNKVLSDGPLPTHVFDGIQYALSRAHRWSVIDVRESPAKDGHYPRKPLFFENFGKPLISVDLDSKPPCISTRLVTMPLFFEEKVHLAVRHRCLLPDGQTERTTFDFGSAFIFDLLVLRDGKEIESHTLDIIYDIEEKEASAIKSKMGSWFSTLYAFPRAIRGPIMPKLESESDSDSDESDDDEFSAFVLEFADAVREAAARISAATSSILENEMKKMADSEIAASSSSKETSNQPDKSLSADECREELERLRNAAAIPSWTSRILGGVPAGRPGHLTVYRDEKTGYYVSFDPETLVLSTSRSREQIDRSKFKRLSVANSADSKSPYIQVYKNGDYFVPLYFPRLETEELVRHFNEEVLLELTALVIGIQKYILSLK